MRTDRAATTVEGIMHALSLLPSQSASAVRLGLRFERAIRHLRIQRACDVLDELLAGRPLEDAVDAALMPALQRLATDADPLLGQLAGDLVEDRMLALGAGWDRPDGPRTVIACPAGERRTIHAVVLALAAGRRGCGVVWLGATRFETFAADAAHPRTAAAVLVASEPRLLLALRCLLPALDAHVRLLLGGPGASRDVARAIGLTALPADGFSAAERIVPARRRRTPIPRWQGARSAAGGADTPPARLQPVVARCTTLSRPHP
jgi:hypothetical protein